MPARPSKYWLFKKNCFKALHCASNTLLKFGFSPLSADMTSSPKVLRTGLGEWVRIYVQLYAFFAHSCAKLVKRNKHSYFSGVFSWKWLIRNDHLGVECPKTIILGHREILDGGGSEATAPFWIAQPPPHFLIMMMEDYVYTKKIKYASMIFY